MKNNKGFVVSAVLYPLLVLFLALIMGLLSMSDTRKRILDKMKLEISDSIFDEATCSCDTILNKLNYLIKNGVSGGSGGGGSYTYNVLGLNVKKYGVPSELPNAGNSIGDIAMITPSVADANYQEFSYWVASTPPNDPKEGQIWIVQDIKSPYFVTSDYSKIGVGYAMEYYNGEWVIRKTYVYNEQKWQLLYYVPVIDGVVDLTSPDINIETEWNYGYTGEYQTFSAPFSGYYQIELWGAQGGSYNSTYYGGKGAYTSGEIYLDAGEMLYVYVGGQGNSTTGGWNGGGTGYLSSYGRGGGGATDIRLNATSSKEIWNEFDSLKSRIMVAAGGGGGDYKDDGNQGGAGGGLVSSYESTRGGYFRLATQSTSGLNINGTGAGGFGYGGNALTTYAQGANGGGGGYYGGAGSQQESGGIGGTSYISGHEGCSSITEDSLVNNIIHTGNAVHYSGKYFNDTIMVSGIGYSWDIESGSKTDMPSYDGKTTMIGNSGNGYAKIMLKSIEIKEKEDIAKKHDETLESYNFFYSGAYQVFTAPTNGTYKVELWGAQGGSYNSTYSGGLGAYTSGEIYLKENQKLYIYVGGQPYLVEQGWNGGGTGYLSSYGRGGGGATDVRLVSTSSISLWNEFESLKSRIMVAAGGGGGDYKDDGCKGMSGGGLKANFDGGRGGYAHLTSQELGGINNYGGGIGGFGIGGHAETTYNQGANGGGGGYYGGAGGKQETSGIGGTSYISGHLGCNSISEESTSTNIIHTGQPFHFSENYFENTTIIDGSGYLWSTKRENQSNMPSHNGSNTMIGEPGDGYAKITLINNQEKSDNELKNVRLKNSNSWYFGYNGKYQEFTAMKTGTYKIETWGASGYSYTSTYYGGKGAYTSGEIVLSSGDKLYVYIGGKPFSSSVQTGGWNGGGNAYSSYATAGGGATDIRVSRTASLNIWNESDSLKSRIMVAAGGGGADGCDDGNQGGAGGGLTASYDSARGSVAALASQTAGGIGKHSTASSGGFGYGGAYAVSFTQGNPGSGSGWYGGNGGRADQSAATGGSSYISGHAGCIAVTEDALPKIESYTTLIDSISYTGYKFINTQMIDGNGYPWTTVKSGAASGMPTWDGTTTMIGNSNHGYAKITYLGA